MKKQLVFFDIDGTLLFNNTEFSKRNIEALKKLKADGHEIFINSGRSRSVVPDFLTDMVEFDGFICGSSYVEYHGEVLHRANIDNQTVSLICRYVKEKGIRTLLEGEERAYAIHGGVFHDGIDITSDLEDRLLHPEKLMVTKFTFECDLSDEAAKLFPGVRIINFGGYSEAIVSGFDKAFGMKLLCDKTGVSYKDTVAFGDSVNDREMLFFAGKSVAMKSAPEEFDKFITYRANSDFCGVALGIDKIFGENE